MNNSHIIFGGQGFIGQNLALSLLDLGHKVLSIDKDLWSLPYSKDFLQHNNSFFSLRADIVDDEDKINDFIHSIDFDIANSTVWHLAANSDIAAGSENANIDLRDTFLTTTNVINLCSHHNIRTICFASSSAVYGSWAKDNHAYKETDMTKPISNYGAMKLASEAILSSAAEYLFDRVEIFRFPNVVGNPATHGVIRDLIIKLRRDSICLEVLGDGQQTKPYLHVSDLIDAMCFLAFHESNEPYRVCNIGSDNSNVSVKQIAELVVKEIAPNAKIFFGSSPGGWIGDVPKVFFDNSKIQNFGWRAKLNGLDAVHKTILDLKDILK